MPRVLNTTNGCPPNPPGVMLCLFPVVDGPPNLLISTTVQGINTAVNYGSGADDRIIRNADGRVCVSQGDEPSGVTYTVRSGIHEDNGTNAMVCVGVEAMRQFLREPGNADTLLLLRSLVFNDNRDQM